MWQVTQGVLAEAIRVTSPYLVALLIVHGMFLAGIIVAAVLTPIAGDVAPDNRCLLLAQQLAHGTSDSRLAELQVLLRYARAIQGFSVCGVFV